MTWTPTKATVTGRFTPFSPAPPSPPPPPRLYERAITFAAMGFPAAATKVLSNVTARAPDHGPAWQKLADLLRLAGEDRQADAAQSRADRLGSAWPAAIDPRPIAEIEAAESNLRRRMGQLASTAEQFKTLREHLRGQETDVTAMRLLGRLEWREGALETARALFERALDLAPRYEGARADLARLLRVQGEDARAAMESKRLVEGAPSNVDYRTLYADALRSLGDLQAALPIIEQLITEDPGNARFRCVHGQALHFAGRREESAEEFRASLDRQPGMGEAYWGLAELRGGYLTGEDISAMRRHLADPDQETSSRMLIHYALGQALEQAGDLAGGFAAYAAGAALAKETAENRGDGYDQMRDAEQVRRRRTVFSAATLAKHASPAQGATPIFVLGMPRAGSTLVEQILASHSQVEPTVELPVLRNLVGGLSRSRVMVTPDAYPECVSDLSVAQLTALGARYIEEAAPYRKTDRAWFIDKRPGNWLDVGLIAMILPHAKIIDIRRQPMAACFAMYKQMLDDEAAFSNDFDDLAQHYTDYVRLMAHYERAMPGRIHFLSYERLVEDTESEIRALLNYCGLPFEAGCLSFWRNDRVVATPSAEQVRRPIFRDGLEQWRRFEPWLGPLKDALTAAEAAAPQPAGYDYALTLAAMNMYEAAIDQLRAITTRVPSHPDAWSKLAELIRYAGRDEEADAAETAAARCANEAAKWRPTRDRRGPARLDDAEQALADQIAAMDRQDQMDAIRGHLLSNPTDAAAAHVLARLEWQGGDEFTALSLLERTLELSPSRLAARAELAGLLMMRSDFIRALEQTRVLVRQAPDDTESLAIHADALKRIGDFPAALAVTEDLLRRQPGASTANCCTTLAGVKRAPRPIAPRWKSCRHWARPIGVSPISRAAI
jgi:predicted Zn-dependent protease